MVTGALLHPSLNERESWVKRYCEVHNVDLEDARVEYKRRRRAMSLFDISLVEYFSLIDKDPTDPNNLRAFMASIEKS